MQHHDLLAELEGYRNAHASAVRYGDGKQAKAIEAEIERVTNDIKATVEYHELQAHSHDGNGQHTLGGQARERAARLRAAIRAEDESEDAPATEDPTEDAPATEDAAEKTPRERAVTKKAGN